MTTRMTTLVKPPLLAARDLAVSIAGKPIVQQWYFALHAGERLAILGRNGVGKSTLLHTLAGLHAADAGDIELAGDRYATLGPRCAARLRGLLPQHQADAFAASVLDSVLIGRHPYLSRWDWESAADEELAHAALTAVGLADLAARSLHTLSGGERQRVALATLLVQQPKVYLLDEPLAHLDLNHQIGMLSLMSQRVQVEQAAAVMVLHDVNLAARFSDKTLLLYGAGEYEFGDSEVMLNAERLSRLYDYPLRVIESDNRAWFIPKIS